jgi:replicative DNA helicase
MSSKGLLRVEEKLCDHHSEWCLIACAFIEGSPGSVEELGVVASDFYHPDHKALWTSICNVAAKGLRCEPSVVVDDLRSSGSIEPTGGWIKLIISITTTVETSSSIGYWAKKVRRLGAQREALREADIMSMKMLESGEADLTQSISKFNAINERIHGVSKKISIGLAVSGVRQWVKDRRSGMVFDGDFNSPYPMLDRRIGRGQRGRLECIAARPGVGKSVDGLCRFISGVNNGYKCCYFTLEMPIDETIKRIASNGASVNMLRIDEEPKSKIKGLDEFLDNGKGGWVEFWVKRKLHYSASYGIYDNFNKVILY